MAVPLTLPVSVMSGLIVAVTVSGLKNTKSGLFFRSRSEAMFDVEEVSASLLLGRVAGCARPQVFPREAKCLKVTQ